VFWAHQARLTRQALVEILSPLGKLDFVAMVNTMAWWCVLRPMVGYACFFAWASQLDSFTPDGHAWITTVQARRRRFYAIVREIPLRFHRPGLDTIQLA
jgi:hypothetical protein